MVYMYHSFLIHLSADGHLGCFLFRFLKTLCLLLSQDFFLKCSFPATGLLNNFICLRSLDGLQGGCPHPLPSSLSPSKHCPLSCVVIKPRSLPLKDLFLILVSHFITLVFYLFTLRVSIQFCFPSGS